MYLDNCKTIEELKAGYRTWTKKLHPDLGGDTESMKILNNEYDELFNVLKNKHNATHDEKHQCTETPEEFRDIIEKLFHIEGIDIELCGSWLWISGETYAHKAELKAAGCMWASQKKMWYWRHPEDGMGHNRKSQSMDYIRSKYGSQYIDREGRESTRIPA